MSEPVELFRVATPEEFKHFEEKVYPLQDRVMERVSSEAVYLSGGTALSRFYFNHRFSEDLDFFFDGSRFPEEEFDAFCRKAIRNLAADFDRLEVALDGRHFKRLFVHESSSLSLKTEFIFEPFGTVGEKKAVGCVTVDSKENICANKVSAARDRRATRDFYDLFFLLKEIDLARALEWARLKQVPPDYEGLLVSVGDLLAEPGRLEGQVVTTGPVDEAGFWNFVKSIVKELLDHAKSGSPA